MQYSWLKLIHSRMKRHQKWQKGLLEKDESESLVWCRGCRKMKVTNLKVKRAESRIEILLAKLCLPPQLQLQIHLPKLVRPTIKDEAANLTACDNKRWKGMGQIIRKATLISTNMEIMGWPCNLPRQIVNSLTAKMMIIICRGYSRHNKDSSR